MTDFWKRKLLAYLHDPPSKAVNIADHERHGEGNIKSAEDAIWWSISTVNQPDPAAYQR
jgi:hypothetical protein